MLVFERMGQFMVKDVLGNILANKDRIPPLPVEGLYLCASAGQAQHFTDDLLEIPRGLSRQGGFDIRDQAQVFEAQPLAPKRGVLELPNTHLIEAFHDFVFGCFYNSDGLLRAGQGIKPGSTAQVADKLPASKQCDDRKPGRSSFPPTRHLGPKIL